MHNGFYAIIGYERFGMHLFPRIPWPAFAFCAFACGAPVEHAVLPPTSAFMLAMEGPPPVPSCSPAPADCAPTDLDPARCVEDPTPFEVTVLDDYIVDIYVHSDIVAGLGLAPGRWWTSFADPLGGCDIRVVEFEVAASDVSL